MAAQALHSLVTALAASEGRADAAAALAQALGCAALALFVSDVALGVLVPAPGMPKTFAGGPLWRAFLAACKAPGRHAAQVDLREGAQQATALSHDGTVAVLLGGAPDEQGLDVLRAELPLLGALLRTEQALKINMASAAEARDAASRAHALAKSLDAARAASAELNQQLRREHGRKDEFLAMLAHELRNPLSPLVNSIAILRRADAGAPIAQRQLDVMERQLTQLTRLVDDLLDVSRVSRGLIELKREQLLLSEVLEAAVDAVRPALDARRQQLQLMGVQSPLHVNADRVRLTQVFANLLQNAAKYTDPGGTIGVSVTPDFGRVSVMVRDNGMGIPPEMLPHVFELFAQAPVSLDRSQGGLGIGLTLVRTLAQLHGGHVTAHSVGLGHGSTFTVSLPLIAAPKPAARAGGAAPKAVERRQLKVLVVDDSPDNADSLAEVLRMMGAQTVIAHDGPQALERAARELPALVLLDIGLPGMDGYETARRLRSGSTRRMHIVALTGYGSHEDRERSRAAGFDAHLVKPISAEQIEKLLASVASVAA